MAKIGYRLPEDFLLKVSKLAENTDKILPKVLKAGAEVVCKKVKSNLASAIGKNTKVDSRSTGELEAALGISPALHDRNGNMNVKIGFLETRSDGKSNAMLANILEYGKSGQPPKPFLKPAKSQKRVECIEAMKSELESEIEGI